mgnify:FL=1
MSVSAVTARLITMSKGDKMWLSRTLMAKSTVSSKYCYAQRDVIVLMWQQLYFQAQFDLLMK